VQIEIGLGDSQGRRTLYGVVGAAIVVALFVLGHFVTPVEAQAPQMLTPERWQAAALARKAAAEVVHIDSDMGLLADLLEVEKPEPVPAMLLAQRVYARHREGTSATAPVRLALIAAAEAAARYASGASDRETALAALTLAATHLASFQPNAAAPPLPPETPTAPGTPAP
jgi:hypothetical protein